ncbi:hypothetical protein ACQJBY_047890 [Aegilops geniculata]
MTKRNIGSDEDLRLHRTMVKRKKQGLQLTNLPTDILCSILSQLPIKEAVRTSILSEQWKYLWHHHPNLVFTLSSILPIPRTLPLTPNDDLLRKREFIQRVDAVVQQHSGVGVENVQFRAPFGDDQRDQINRWVNFAIASKAKQLIFDFLTASPIRPPYNFDLRLLDDRNSLHLRYVKLCSVSLKVPADFNGFQNLKWIYLADTNITDDDLQLLMSNCCVLELLGIACCRMLTRLQLSRPSNPLKHLHVHDCRLLQAMELNFGLVELQYTGSSILLSPPGTLLLKSMCIELNDMCPSLEYIFTKLDNNVPRLEMLTLQCTESKRASLPGKLHKFSYLKHLRLELTFFGAPRSRSDILDFACLLVAAPFLEKLDFHMVLRCEHPRYMTDQGDLRSLPSEPHLHLRLVEITGFYGWKGQLELALHILRNSVALEAMKIDPIPAPAVVVGSDFRLLGCTGFTSFSDGYKVALEFLCSADHRNAVHVREP